jgi:hypothetical protein
MLVVERDAVVGPVRNADLGVGVGVTRRDLDDALRQGVR